MKKILLPALILWYAGLVSAQRDATNQDESQVPVVTLPEALICLNGEKVTSAAQWEQQRRPELLALFANQMYGESFAGSAGISQTYEILAENANDLSGKAVSKQVKITFKRENIVREALLLIYLPKAVKGKAPVFLSYNYNGNHSINPDPWILISPLSAKIPSDDPTNVRGNQIRRWPLEMIIDAGFGVVTLCYHDIYPDNNEGKDGSILPLSIHYEAKKNDPHAEQAIGAWAWGLSRVVDYLETEKQIDGKQIILMGHSRQGKAALWAGAQDRRFAIVISNNSGCGGAALSKRRFGENVKVITTNFPHWFTPAFSQYADKEATLPFDQHELIALMAPRPVYIASAQEDLWADPKGEFLSGVHAGPVYALYGLKGLETNEMPTKNTPIMNHIGYHIRTGNHDVTDFDWQCFIRFAQKHLANDSKK
ncbi:MAG: acetylxylan esterase [Tannerella sp.]|jgi:hypothetical protein|nr:acetylxylan esterase [Tannerella sp.]